MDPAKEVERHLLSFRKPIDDAIENSHSSIQQFYDDATIFVTGGSGFLGKQLIEKLFRSCNIKKVYFLMRPKKGKPIHERLAAVLEDQVYDELRKKKPNFAESIVPIAGDVAELKLGISEQDWATLTEEVNLIFHVAATVRFDEPIKVATLINVRGTRETLGLGEECKNLKCFTHVSTAFAHATRDRINGDVEEKFYEAPLPPDVLIDMVENMDEMLLNSAVISLMRRWPNTYTFTKAIGEELIRTHAPSVTKCIVKPPVVISSFLEPAPGWIDAYACMSSIVGMMLGAGIGVLHVHLSNPDLVTCYAPVDYVNNAIIAAAWDAAVNKRIEDKEPPIYTVSSTSRNIKWKEFSNFMRSEKALKLVTPKCVYYGFGVETGNLYVHWLLTWIIHYIPGYIVDGILDLLKARPKGVPRLMKVYEKLNRLVISYKYFSSNNWYISDDNLRAMIQRMSNEDKVIYNCDLTTVEFEDLFKALIIGLRKFIVKDDLEGSEIGYNKQKHQLKYLHIFITVVYGYILYTVARTLFNMIGYVAQSFFN